ncbi:hypothetical protein [Ureaplasma diversum]|uniref:hypothetical protein n=1 Tax=Ureaplasma diversum TaxID=42094 RepID=UPI0005713EC6|nr:hypothetical protein [Ureaplasma diversum]
MLIHLQNYWFELSKQKFGKLKSGKWLIFLLILAFFAFSLWVFVLTALPPKYFHQLQDNQTDYWQHFKIGFYEYNLVSPILKVPNANRIFAESLRIEAIVAFSLMSISYFVLLLITIIAQAKHKHKGKDVWVAWVAWVVWLFATLIVIGLLVVGFVFKPNGLELTVLSDQPFIKNSAIYQFYTFSIYNSELARKELDTRIEVANIVYSSIILALWFPALLIGIYNFTLSFYKNRLW